MIVLWTKAAHGHYSKHVVNAIWIIIGYAMKLIVKIVKSIRGMMMVKNVIIVIPTMSNTAMKTIVIYWLDLTIKMVSV
jgi:hypothetical protein